MFLLGRALQWLSLSDFIASDLVYFEAMAATAVITASLTRARRGTVTRYCVTMAVTAIVSVICALIATSVVFIAPVGVRHVTDGTQNSFPSHHALLAALVVSAVFLAQPRKVLPFVVVSSVIDVALIAGRHHHLLDVVASTVFVSLGTLVAVRSSAFQGRVIARLERYEPVARRVQPPDVALTGAPAEHDS